MSHRTILVLGLLLLFGAVGCQGSVGSTETTSPSPSSTKATTQAEGLGTTSTPPGTDMSSAVLMGHAGWVTVLAWSPDGTELVSSSGDYQTFDDTIRLWSRDGTPIATLKSPTAPVYSVAWSPDGSILASGSEDGYIQLRSADGTLLRTLRGEGSIYSLAWAPDGKTLATGSIVKTNENVVQWWEPESGAPLRRYLTDASGGKFYNLGWSPDGRSIVAGAIDYKLWSKDGDEIAHILPSRTPAWAFAWSPDSLTWAIGNENGDAFLYDSSGRQIGTFQNAQGSIDCLACSPDGKLLAGGDGVNLWASDGTLVETLGHDTGRVTAVAWSPDGRWLAAGTSGGSIMLWERNGSVTETLSGHTDSVARLAWSPDSGMLASGSYDRTIRLWKISG